MANNFNVPVDPQGGEKLADKVKYYWKFVIAAAGVIALVGSEVIQAYSNGAADGTLDTTDVIQILIAAGAAIGVYAKGQKPLPKK